MPMIMGICGSLHGGGDAARLDDQAPHLTNVVSGTHAQSPIGGEREKGELDVTIINLYSC